MTSRLSWIRLAVLTGIAMLSPITYACSCMGGEITALSYQIGYCRAEAVFAGTVRVATREDNHRSSYILEVVESYKGELTKYMETLPSDGTDCGYRFERNGSYLVFVSALEGKNDQRRMLFRANACGLSKAVSDFEYPEWLAAVEVDETAFCSQNFTRLFYRREADQLRRLKEATKDALDEGE